MSAVSASHIAKRFGAVDVLRDVSLTVREREIVGLLGPSGCGKTTLLRILLGLETFDAGEVPSSIERAGYLPQEGLLLPWKTIQANAELPLALRGVGRVERARQVREALPTFGLEGFGRAYPHQISGGMRQRAALLRAVLTGSSTLVLDEPFGALDAVTRQRLQDWLAQLARRLRRTILFVTHDVEETVVLADRIVILSPRPATVVAEERVDLGAEERGVRVGWAFLAVRDRVVAHLQREWT